MHIPRPATLPSLAALAFAVLASGVQAQSFCASDGQRQPTQLMERFINSDCETCWSDPATPKPNARTVALDWVVPGNRGDDAPLSAVATRDAELRQDALGLKAAPSAVKTTSVGGLTGGKLRVSHGQPVNDYIGSSIEIKPIPQAAKKQLWTATLALVETLPVGTEGSPVERNLVRNLLQTDWDGRKPLAKGDTNRFFDARSMSLPQGADPSRLRVIGWVQDARGKVLAAAQSRCIAVP